MAEFSAADLAKMRAAQEAHMMDACKLQACVETADSFNQLVQTWPVDGSELVCGLDMSTGRYPRPGSEEHGADMTVLEYDATLRLPITATPNAKDRVKITKRFGETLSTPLIYDIVGPIQRGPSGVQLLLKRIET
jgi:hypothetical protein